MLKYSSKHQIFGSVLAAFAAVALMPAMASAKTSDKPAGHLVAHERPIAAKASVMPGSERGRHAVGQRTASNERDHQERSRGPHRERTDSKRDNSGRQG